MIKKDLHTHTLFSDGNNTPEEMVLAAIKSGLDTIGISDHSYTFFDERYCLKKDKIAEYKAHINALKEKYKSEITVLCGIEQDYYSDVPADGYDYVIGSVHYIKVGETYIPIDDDPADLTAAANNYFSGDIYALAEEYFRTVADAVNKTGADIIGHLDLISKFNQKTVLFDEENPRYVAAWKTAVDKLLPSGVPFEINTAPLMRGYRDTPYPAKSIRQYITSNGGKVLLSSDAHSIKGISRGFENFI